MRVRPVGIRDGAVPAVLLTLIGLDLVLVAVGALSYRPFFSQPGSAVHLAVLVGLLLLYAVLILILTHLLDPYGYQRHVLWGVAAVGAVMGLVTIMNISMETFGDPPKGITPTDVAKLTVILPQTLASLFWLFWAFVGGWAAETTNSLWQGVLGAAWSIVVTMLTSVTFGLGLALATHGRLERILADDPDFINSGSTDLRAFALAYTFDNVSLYLSIALIMGTYFGWFGSLLGIHALRYH